MIDEFLNSEKKIVDRELEKYFRQLKTNEGDILFSDFLTEFRLFFLNEKAKRLHPILLIAAFGGIVNPMYLDDQIKEIRKVSLAMEFLHNAHLIHDDLVDDDELRRGNLTFHRQLKQDLQKLYTDQELSDGSAIAEKYGNNISILGGAYGYLAGINIIKNSNFPENLKLMAIKEFTEAIDYLLKGHIIEEYMDSHKITMSLEQYLDIAEMVRARMFEKSVKIGAILAKGNIHYQINPLSEAMLRIGQAYAIRDDINDIRRDIQTKKKKIVYILAVQNINEQQSKELKELFRKKNLTESDIDQIIKIFKDTKAIEIAQHLSQNLIAQAKNYLNDIYPDLNKEQKRFFTEFADYILQTEL